MGFQLENTSERSSKTRITKKVVHTVQRTDTTTHNYIVHITLNAAGFLPEKLTVILKERDGLPGNFKDIKENYRNLHVYDSRAGWTNKDLAKEWMLKDFLPMVEPNSVLIIDSWVGYKDMIGLAEVAAKGLKIEVLPPGSATVLQPADVYFNRTFKHFVRRVSDKIRWRHLDFVLSVRTNLLTILDLAYNQFKAPLFKSFLQYPWYKAGYHSDHPPEFSSPVEFCLHFKGFMKCESDSCTQNLCFMRCAYCAMHLCFDHIINHRHWLFSLQYQPHRN